jgi:hypothetical protein
LPADREAKCGRSFDQWLPGQHVIFYRVKDNIAEIVRVLDSRHDVGEILAERG